MVELDIRWQSDTHPEFEPKIRSELAEMELPNVGNLGSHVVFVEGHTDGPAVTEVASGEPTVVATYVDHLEWSVAGDDDDTFSYPEDLLD